MPWPWPADTREDRARRVALSYRQLLIAVLGEHHAEVVALDSRWSELGATWVQPSLVPLRVEDWLTAGEMAGVFHMDPRVFRDWARRGWIRVMVSNGKRRYNVGDVVEYSKKRHQRKSACATIGLETPCPETSFG